jgi:transposase
VNSKRDPCEAIAKQAAIILRQTATIVALEKRVGELVAELQVASAKNVTLEGRVAELEARLGANSSNSSKPPSSDGPAERGKKIPKPATGRRRGAQSGHAGHIRALLPPDEAVRYEPVSCNECGAELTVADASVEDGAIWQVAELPRVEAHITHHIATGRRCACGEVTHGAIPAPVLAHGYGPNFCAVVALLATQYGMSKRNIQAFSNDVLGISVSTGTLCALSAELGSALEPSVNQALDYIRQEEVVYADETGWRMDKTGGWLWVIVGRLVTVFLMSATRGKLAARALLGANFLGKLVTDRWSAYTIVAREQRQFCLAHLLRDATGMSERGNLGAAIGRHLERIFRSAIKLFYDRRDGLIDQLTFEKTGAILRAECLLRLNAGAALEGVRDKRTRGMCKALAKAESCIWTFLSSPNVEPTNNRAERAIRPAVIVRKLSFGSDSQKGAENTARVLSAVASLRTQARGVFAFFQETIRTARAGKPTPSLLPQK